MNQTSNNVTESVPIERHNSPIESRIFRTMTVAVVVAVAASVPFGQWRITTGLLLGGSLSLLNHHWLRSSAAAAFSVIAHGAKPRLSLANYVLRYLVISAAVFFVYKFNLVSLAATIVGLCSFVVALFVEAIREFYFAIMH
jgi:ATP synthase I subunit